jgi:rhodanese-related sulfurtransferase
MTILIIVTLIVIMLVVINLSKNRGIKQVNAESAQKMAVDPQVAILDVRTPEEFREGHIPGAKLMPVSEINGRLPEIASLKERPVLVYCRTGNRSGTASQILKKNGFTKISNFQGGIIAWNNSGNKIVKGN